MTTGTIEITTLTPSEGMMLTQAENVASKDRVFSEKIFLAVNDSPGNWMEIPRKEAEAFIAARNAEIQDMLEGESRNMVKP